MKKKSRRDYISDIYLHQVEVIKEKYNKKTADVANYGWGAACYKKEMSIATKVYRKQGAMVLTTNFILRTGEIISEEWSEY